MLNWRKDKKEEPPATGAAKPATAASSPSASRPPAASLGTPKPGNPASIEVHGRLGDMLTQEGVISAAQLNEALKKQRESGGFLGQILVEMSFIDQSTLVSFLVKQCKIPHISLLDYVVSEELFSLVPKELCLKYSLLPIDKLGRILTLAMVDPLDVDALEQVRSLFPDLKIKPILCDWNHFQSVSKRVFHMEQREAQEVTAGSFGLPEQRTKKPPQAAPDPSQTAVDATVDALVKQAAVGKPAPAPKAPPAKTDAVTGQVARPAPEPAREVRTASSAEIAAQVGHSVRAAMAEVLGPLLNAQRAHMAAAPPPSPALDAKALAGELNANVRQALHEAVGVLIREQQKLHEPLAELAKEIRATTGQPHKPEHPDAAGLTAAIRESIRGAYAEQESRLHQVVETAVQAVHAAEATLRTVQEEREEAEERPKSLTRIAHLEVFPAPGRGPSADGVQPAPRMDHPDALDTPGMGMEADERVREALDSDHVLGGYTFEKFLAGPLNQFSLKAARAVGEQLARDFNPLYIFGEEGLGKTHLLYAIGNAALAQNPDLRVACVSASHFASACASARQHDQISEFRDRYCRWDMLLIDDVQFLEGRRDAQEELFHIVNALLHEGRILVLAGDRSPDHLPDMQRGLVSRFSSGIVTRIRPPEMEVRIAILKRYAGARRVSVPDDILSLIAARIATDVRKMTGALRKVIAYATLVEQDMTRDMANEILSSLGIDEAA